MFFIRCPSFIVLRSRLFFPSFRSVTVFSLFLSQSNQYQCKCYCKTCLTIDTRADSLRTFKSNRYFYETFAFTFLLVLLCVNFFPIFKREKTRSEWANGGRNKGSSHFLYVQLENDYSLIHTDSDGEGEKKFSAAEIT